MGCGPGVRLSRRRHQRAARRVGPRRQRAGVRPGPARGDVGLRGRRATRSSAAGSASAPPPAARARCTCSTASTTPSSTTSRWWRSSARPPRSAMGGAYQQEIDLLSLFKDVCSEYVQMCTVPEQLPNLLDRAIRIAVSRLGAHLPDLPERRAGARVHAARPRVQGGALEPRHGPAASCSPTTTRSAARPTSSTPAARSRCWSARAPAAAPSELTQVADLLGAGAAKALLGKDVLPDTLPVGDRLDRAARDDGELQADDGVRHAADRRLELPVHAVLSPAGPGAGRPDRPGRRDDRVALPLRAQPRRRRQCGAPGADPAAASARPTAAGGSGSSPTSPTGGRPPSAGR